ncbi:MAG: AmmeMemoRadiSam system radical SAM enzyme [Dethiobacteraceae bacterium]|jgi:pyruvate formate lyase activating enzyme|nr:AmmeMemoRadiSam system radical SAM enzyme [Bacillota bacterium]
MREALYYTSKQQEIICQLCPHFCRLQEGESGLCGVRQVCGQRLFSLNYGLCAALAVDPLEKKPLYHFYPGQQILSVGTVGCNLDCGFCQNWQLVRAAVDRRTQRYTPAALVQLLTEQQLLGIAYTYSEPGVWYEFVLETAGLVKQQGFKNVLVTNGYLNPEPLRELLPYIDAFNIDVKAFQDQYYRQYCAGRLKPVLRYVEAAAAAAHVELTYLVVPTLNDQERDVRRFVDWVAALNPKIPVHFTRYYPQRRFNYPPTPAAVMKKLQQIAREKLSYVYLGNLPGIEVNTDCPVCGSTMIERDGYQVINKLRHGCCPHCGQAADILPTAAP